LGTVKGGGRKILDLKVYLDPSVDVKGISQHVFRMMPEPTVNCQNNGNT
jgi:hypothetical protein